MGGLWGPFSHERPLSGPLPVPKLEKLCFCFLFLPFSTPGYKGFPYRSYGLWVTDPLSPQYEGHTASGLKKCTQVHIHYIESPFRNVSSPPLDPCSDRTLPYASSLPVPGTKKTRY